MKSFNKFTFVLCPGRKYHKTARSRHGKMKEQIRHCNSNTIYRFFATGEANIFGESEGNPPAEAVEEVYGSNLNKANNETYGQSGASVLEGSDAEGTNGGGRTGDKDNK